jgi:DNA-binding response OmpR family regulator
VDERTVLVVEDDAAIREGVADALRSEGYRVLEAPDGVKGLALGLTEDPDLIVLDLMLPGMQGFDVLRRLRADAVETPVLVLTAKGLERDKVEGFALGADDYLVKPFGLAEFLARVASRLRAWDRERGRGGHDRLRLGAVTVDFDARAATRDGEPLPMTPLELDLLRHLARREGRAVSRAELLRDVWKGAETQSRVVDTAILGLRKKIGPEHVVTVRGLGYRLER